jgi:hypothetical protein
VTLPTGCPGCRSGRGLRAAGLAVSLGLLAQPASAAWLLLCDGAREVDELGRQYADPAGNTQTLVIGDTPLAGCASVELPVASAEVRWAGLVSRRTGQQVPGGLGLVGEFDRPAAAVSEVVVLAPPADDTRVAQPSERATRTSMPRDRGELPRSPVRSTWLWQVGGLLADPAAWASALEDNGIGVVFVAVPMTGDPPKVAEPEALGQAIAVLRAAGIAVLAVEGDPAAVTAAGRVPFLARTRALARFNAAQPPARRLAGVQYDVEPYLMPHYALDATPWLRAYAETVAALSAAAEMPVELAVPFWWHGLGVDGVVLLDVLASTVDGVTVMNYRTDPAEIARLAKPFLAWGERHDRAVRIGLEVGPLPDQQMLNFRAGAPGRLWHLRLGDADALVLLHRPAANPAGRTLQQRFSVPVPAANTTFIDQRERLAEVLPPLTRQWSESSAFAGVALHEYLEPASLVSTLD